MSLIDDLIDRATADRLPRGLSITADQIGQLAAHVQSSKWPDKSIEEIKTIISLGQLIMLELPVRVRGLIGPAKE